MREMDDDGMPPRMKLGNEARPERVPTEGHEGSVPVDDATWRSNDQRVDTAEKLAADEAPTERSEAQDAPTKTAKQDPSDHSAAGQGLSG